MDITTRLVAISALGVRRDLVEATDIVVNWVLNESPSLRFRIPFSWDMARGLPWGDPITNLIGRYDIAVEVNVTGSESSPGAWFEPASSRFVITKSSADGEPDGGTLYEATGVDYDLSGAVNQQAAYQDRDSKAHKYVGRSPGFILADFISGARALGLMPRIGRDFSDTRDSGGTLWSTSLDLDFPATATIADVMSALDGSVDWRFDGETLRVWNFGGLRRDTNAELVFGRDFEEMPERQSTLGVADKVLAVGQVETKGKTVTITSMVDAPANVKARSTRGPRAHVVSMPNVPNTAKLTSLATVEAGRQSAPLEERTRTLLPTAATIPYQDFNVGDTLLLQQGSGEFERTRVQAIRFEVSKDTGAKWSVTFGDIIPSTQTAVVRKLKSSTGVAKTAGPPGIAAPVQSALGLPRPPLSVTVTKWTTPGQGGAQRSGVTLSWLPPEDTVLSLSPADVDAYEVTAKLRALPGETVRSWESWGRTSNLTLTKEDLPPGRTWDIEVRCRNREGWSSATQTVLATAVDTAPPPEPSAPLLRSDLGTVTVQWDGAFASGASTPGDFSHVLVLAGGKVRGRLYSSSSTVTYSAETYDTETVSLIAVDTSGNQSTSSSATVAVRSVLDDSNIAALGDNLAAAQSAADAAVRDASAALTAAGVAVTGIFDEYAISSNPTAPPTSGWSSSSPPWWPGAFVWRRSTVTTGDGESVTGSPVMISGNAGESAALVRIDSSRGTAFKNNAISTTLSVTVFLGARQIRTIEALHEAFGAGAFLEWWWRRVDDSDFGVISSADSRLSNSGFSLTVSPSDVDSQTVFQCVLHD